MSKRKPIWTVLLGLLVIAWLAGCGKGEKQERMVPRQEAATSASGETSASGGTTGETTAGTTGGTTGEMGVTGETTGGTTGETTGGTTGETGVTGETTGGMEATGGTAAAGDQAAGSGLDAAMDRGVAGSGTMGERGAASGALPPSGQRPSTREQPGAYGPYCVQAGSFRTTARAHDQLRKLTDAGFQAIIVEAQVHGETWYRIYVPNLPDLPTANRVAADLRQDVGVETLVRKI